MKLAWIFCLLLAGKLSTASPGDERAPAESNVDSSYMMAFPMNDEDHLAEESAQEAVKILAESLASDDDDDEEEGDDSTTEVKKEEDEKKEDEQPEPMGILQAELAAEDANEEKQSSLPERPFFKRPKIEELRKILGFPPPEGPVKAKPIPQEKPKAFQGAFGKTRPKITTEPSPLGGLQFNLRREDRMRPFGFPMLPLKRDDSSSSFMRPFGLPDLVQAASSILRRAIVDDNNENDISKEDKEEDEQQQIGESEPNEDNEEEEEDDSVMIVPLPDPKEVTIERPPLFRRFPIPLPFPRPVAPQATRPRLPFPPLTPVAFFLPIAQQIMQNIRQSQPSRSPPMMPMIHHPVQPQLQNLVPLQTQMPVVHIQPPMQQQQQFIPLHHPMIHPSFAHHQQIVPLFPVPQAAIHLPVLMPLPPNMQQQQRPVLRQMPRRTMPIHPPQQRRMPFPGPVMQPQMVHHPAMMRRPVQQQQQQHLSGARPRVVRPPVLFMMPAMMQPPMLQHAPQQPVFHGRSFPPFVPAMSQPRQVFHQGPPPPEEERVIFVRPEGQEDDDDQEVLILVPSDEMEAPHRLPPPPPPQFRQVPTPVVNPLQRIRILRDLLLAGQAAHRPQAMQPDARAASRVVEIVQQQLRIFPAHHPQQRPESSELHPVYVPYPGPQ